jgi:hypothetical protein
VQGSGHLGLKAIEREQVPDAQEAIVVEEGRQGTLVPVAVLRMVAGLRNFSVEMYPEQGVLHPVHGRRQQSTDKKSGQQQAGTGSVHVVPRKSHDEVGVAWQSRREGCT